jgi:predicted nuclease of predicted toxin-antitoxin system
VATIVIDEDMHRSVAEPLVRMSHRVLDIRDHGLRGAPDEQIFAFAQQEQAALFTADLDFSNLISFPLGTHHGIIVARFPNELSTARINEEISQGLAGVTDAEIRGRLIIVEIARTRIRRPPQP